MTDNEIFETEIKCIQRRSSGQCNGGSDCCNCDLLMSDKDIISAYERAIQSNETNEALIAGQETLQKALAEKIAEVEELTGNLKFVRGTVERQKAEIERLKNDCFCIANERDAIGDCLNEAVAEAIKEFAERLKSKLFVADDNFNPVVTETEIDKIVKETTEPSLLDKKFGGDTKC